LKATGRNNWGLMRDAVEEINQARARGVMITADQYPFLQGAPIDYITSLIDVPSDMQPLYELARSIEERDIALNDQSARRQQYVAALQDALRDPEMRSRLKESTYEKRPDNPSAVARWGWQDFRIKVAVDNAAILEKNVAELIEEQGRDGFDIIADLVQSEPDILFAAASQSPDDMRHAMKQPWVMISSDGGTFPATDILDTPVRAHPRSFASQAIVLRKFVREEGVLTFEDAVRKMTSLPAQILQLPDRGLLVRGYKADIAIFDADEVQDQATYDDARRHATGVEYVLVNGEVSVAAGRFTGVRAGNVLLKRQAN
jgi:N-acyl-D-amino-acid deacylase